MIMSFFIKIYELFPGKSVKMSCNVKQRVKKILDPCFCQEPHQNWMGSTLAHVPSFHQGLGLDREQTNHQTDKQTGV